MGCFPGGTEPCYQLVYIGKENLPLFIEIHAENDVDAERQAQEWIAGNKEELGNPFVELHAVVKRFNTQS